MAERIDRIPKPERIARLPVDKRGYPIPWNIERGVDDWPLFTVNDAAKDCEALRRKLCPICGEKLGRWMWWSGGARAAFDPNGWYLDRPAHRECAFYALQVCPFLAAPNYATHQILTPPPEKLKPHQRLLIDGSQDHNRPPLFVTVCGDAWEMGDLTGPFIYTRPLRPVAEYVFWRHGERLSQEAALPLLRDLFGRDWEVPECRA
jgi:hypothetical protein